MTTNESEKFWQISMSQPVHEWVTKLEAYCVGGLHGMFLSLPQRKIDWICLTELINKESKDGLDVRARIREALCQKLGTWRSHILLIMLQLKCYLVQASADPDATMSYAQ